MPGSIPQVSKAPSVEPNETVLQPIDWNIRSLRFSMHPLRLSGSHPQEPNPPFTRCRNMLGSRFEHLRQFEIPWTSNRIHSCLRQVYSVPDMIIHIEGMPTTVVTSLHQKTSCRLGSLSHRVRKDAGIELMIVPTA